MKENESLTFNGRPRTRAKSPFYKTFTHHYYYYSFFYYLFYYEFFIFQRCAGARKYAAKIGPDIFDYRRILSARRNTRLRHASSMSMPSRRSTRALYFSGGIFLGECARTSGSYRNKATIAPEQPFVAPATT